MIVRPHRARRRTRVLLFAVACIAALLALEVTVRVWRPFGSRLRGNLILLPVLMRFQWSNAGARKLTPIISNSRNSLGFRGSEPPADFASRLTVVAVGGSTTECLMLNDGESWPEVLGADLSRQLPSLWVNNAGQDGHSTFGHARMVEQHLAALAPKVCLFLVGINEVGRLDLSEYDASLDASRSSPWRRLVAQSELVSVVRALVRARRATASGLGHREHDLRAIADHDVPAPERADVLAFHRTRCLEPYRARLLRLLAQTRAIGSQPVLLTQPALYGDVVDPTTKIALGAREVDTDYLDGSGQRKLNGRVAWEILESYNDVTRAAARATNTVLIDLAREMPKDSALYYDWVHFTALGAKAVADIVGKRLLEVLPAGK
jgi:lysophospholipase L1-like esterase